MRYYFYIKNFNIVEKVGVSFFVRKDVQYEEILKSPNGRIYIIKISGIVITNIYSKSGSQFKIERNTFLQELIIYLQTIKNPYFFVIGDFNVSYEKKTNHRSK